MMTLADRAKRAVFWKQQFDEVDALVRAHGAGILGETDFQRYKLMQDFANRGGDVLATIAGTLVPQDFDSLANHGFEEGPSGVR